LSGKSIYCGGLPKALIPVKENISVKQKMILSRYMNLVDKKSITKPSFLLTPEGQRGVDVAMKLELKEQQIIAQKELGAPQQNSLLVILREAEERGIIDVTPKAVEIDRISKMSVSRLDKELMKDIDSRPSND